MVTIVAACRDLTCPWEPRGASACPCGMSPWRIPIPVMFESALVCRPRGIFIHRLSGPPRMPPHPQDPCVCFRGTRVSGTAHSSASRVLERGDEACLLQRPPVLSRALSPRDCVNCVLMLSAHRSGAAPLLCCQPLPRLSLPCAGRQVVRPGAQCSAFLCARHHVAVQSHQLLPRHPERTHTRLASYLLSCG